MSDQKVSLEIEILQQSIDIFSQKITELEKKLNQLAKEKKVKIKPDFEEAEKELSKFQKLVNETLSKIGINSSNIESFKKLGTVLSGLAVKIKDMGKEFIEEALNIKGYENAIIRLSKSTEDGQKTIDFINKLALSSQEFSLESLYVAGKHLKNFKLDVEKLLPLISDFADVYGVDVDRASLMFSKALVGTRGGLTTLMTTFGITREELKKFGAEFTKTGVIVPQSAKSIEATMKLLVEYSKKAGIQGEDTAEKFENAVAKYNNSLQLTKIAIGKELLPVITSLMEKISEITVKFSELTIEQKKTIANITLLAGGTVLAGQAINAMIPVINGLRIAYTALSTVLIANPIAAITLAIGGVIYGLEEWYKSQQKLKQARIEDDLKPVNNELKNIRDLIKDINENPLKIDIKVAKENIAGAKDELRSLAVSQYGGDKKFQLESLSGKDTYMSIPNPFARADVREVKTGQSIKDVYEEIEDIYGQILDKQKAGLELTNNEKVVKKDIENILGMIDRQLSGINSHYDKGNQALDETSNKINNLLPQVKDFADSMTKAGEGFANAVNNAFKDKTPDKKPSFMAGETPENISKEIQHKISYQKKLIEAGQSNYHQFVKWIDSFTNKFELSNEDLLELQAEKNQAIEKINTEEQKQLKKQEKAKEDALKEEEKQFQTEYKLFKKSLDEKLKYKKISSDQYIKEMGKFAKDHQKFITPELGDEMNLRNQDVFDKNNEELLKAKEEEGKKIEAEQKKNEAALEKKKSATLEIERQIAENNIEANRLIKDSDNDTTENFIQNEKEKLNSFNATIDKKVENFRLAGVEEIKIRELIASEEKKLQTEILEDFKQKEAEKKTIIEETKIELVKVEKELKKLKDEKEALQQKGSFLTGDEANPTKTLEEAFSSGFNGHYDSYQSKFAEEKDLDNQIKTVEEQKSSLQIKELEASQALATLKQNEAIATGEVVTALQNFSGALNDASSSSGGGAGGPSGDSESADNKGFQNTYSGTMEKIKSSSGDSMLNNPTPGAGDSKNNRNNDAQIGDYQYSTGAIGAGAGAGESEQIEQRKRKSKKRLQDYMNAGAGSSGNMPSDEVYGNLPQNIEKEEGWGNPSLDAEMRDMGGKWAMKNMRLAINKSSEDIMKNFFQGASRNMREINRSLTNNTYNNNRTTSETNNSQNIVIHFDNKQTQNINSPGSQKKVNDFISMALAAKTLR